MNAPSFLFAISLSIVLSACGGGEQPPSIESRTESLEDAVARELSAMEREIGELRARAESADSDFTAEFVRLDDRMTALRRRLEDARVTSPGELQELEAVVRRDLREIEETYESVARRVESETAITSSR